MRKLVWLEVKGLFRRPMWVILLALSALLFYGGEVPDFNPSLTEALTGIPRGPLFSLGEWGRLVLLFAGSVVGGLFALFVSVMAAESFHQEILHREVLWSTPGAAGLRMAGAKFLAVSILATLLILLGSVAALLNPVNRDFLVSEGGVYVPLYFAMLWVQVALWTALAMLISYLTRSRLASIASVTALAVLWFVIGLSGAGLLHRSYLSWNFIGPFAPLGLIPSALFLQTGSLVGLVVVFLAGGLWVRRRWPEWQGVRLPTVVQAVLGVGMALVVGTGGAVIGVLGSRTAPFTAEELWIGYSFDKPWLGALFDKPYIWSKNGVLMVHPGEWMMVRWPRDAHFPMWVQDLPQVEELYYWEDAGEMISEREGNVYTVTPQSLVLIYPPDNPYPAELREAVRHLEREITPLVERASLWQGTVELIITPPNAGIMHFEAVPEGLLVSDDILSACCDWGWCAWELTEPSGLTGPDRLYLWLYLLASIVEERAEEYLGRLHAEARGELEAPTDRPWEVYPLPVPWWDRTWGSEEAARILEHWQKGEEMGHENYIRTLLEGQGD